MTADDRIQSVLRIARAMDDELRELRADLWRTQRVLLARRARAVCGGCGAPASCFGEYETFDGTGAGYACDECCGHSSEDGWCVPVEAADLAVERERVDRLRAFAAALPSAYRSEALRRGVLLPSDLGEEADCG